MLRCIYSRGRAASSDEVAAPRRSRARPSSAVWKDPERGHAYLNRVEQQILGQARRSADGRHSLQDQRAQARLPRRMWRDIVLGRRTPTRTCLPHLAFPDTVDRIKQS
ncbi:hypothetical protein HU200_025233 [Digitaria exilis]|uniref:Uncharacterized protein n=1 Tax=Digitaria exilis TaxID=1010633 RepID=A0A835BX82_9POAL|nr:hypothetical protein HU200_025233 [Digitaria exilis]